MMDLANVSSYVQIHRRSLTSLAFISTVGLGIVVLALILWLTGNDDFPDSWQYSMREHVNDFADWFIATFDWFFGPIGDGVKYLFDNVNDFLSWVPWPVFLAGVFVIVRAIAGPRVGILAIAALAFMGTVGLWETSLTTLSLMSITVIICVSMGIPLGILAARNNTFETIIRPILDMMQVTPTFIYLLPMLMLFGIGNTTAIIAIAIYAMPPIIRLTNLGIRQVPPETVEAARSFGTTSYQTLTKVQLPLAIPSILVGINQSIMFSLICAVFAGLIGAGGLGRDVVEGLTRLELGKALEAGLAIVLMAIVFDRIGVAISERGRGIITPPGIGTMAVISEAPRRASLALASGVGVFIDSVTHSLSGRATVASVQPLLTRNAIMISTMVIFLIVLGINKLVGSGEMPDPLLGTFRGYIDDSVGWLTVNVSFITDWIHDTAFIYAVGPVRDFLFWVPWPVFILVVCMGAWATAGPPVAILAFVGLIFTAMVGMWTPTMVTLGQLFVAVTICMGLGVPLGILMSRSTKAQAIMKPVLDTMQTMPSLVYLIPVVMLFHIGVISALIATVIHAMPPIVRLTNLGIRQVSTEAVETAQSYGATSLQTLVKVQMPLAIPSIMMGVNQVVMIGVAMMVYASLVGNPGLGLEVFRAINNVNIGLGVEAGVSLVLMAVVLDRCTQAWGKKKQIALGLEI